VTPLFAGETNAHGQPIIERESGGFYSNDPETNLQVVENSPYEHGNSLNTERPAEGYSLQDRDTGEICKYGETTCGLDRYSQDFLDEENVDMIFEESGSKRDMHEWQHEKILEFKDANDGERPRLNLNDY